MNWGIYCVICPQQNGVGIIIHNIYVLYIYVYNPHMAPWFSTELLFMTWGSCHGGDVILATVYPYAGRLNTVKNWC